MPLVNAEMAAKNEKWSDALIYALEVFKLDPGHTRALQIEKQARVGILVQSIEAARNRAEIAVRDQSWKAAEDEWEKVNEYAQEIFKLEPQHQEAEILATRSKMWKPLVEGWGAWSEGKGEEAEKLADSFYEIYQKIDEENQENYILEKQSAENLKSDIVVKKNESPDQDEFVKEVLSELYKQGLINQNEYANWSKREDLRKGAENELKSKFVFVGKNFRTLKQKYGVNSGEALYCVMDSMYFTNHTLLDTAEHFHLMGGKHLFLDEVHKYPTWSKELKEIIDLWPDMKITFTGSSLIQILNADADLSRRVLSYDMSGLSFREYLRFYKQIELPAYSLEDVLANADDICDEVCKTCHPQPLFEEYLRVGYYPFYDGDEQEYYSIFPTVLQPDFRRFHDSFIT